MRPEGSNATRRRAVRPAAHQFFDLVVGEHHDIQMPRVVFHQGVGVQHRSHLRIHFCEGGDLCQGRPTDATGLVQPRTDVTLEGENRGLGSGTVFTSQRLVPTRRCRPYPRVVRALDNRCDLRRRWHRSKIRRLQQTLEFSIETFVARVLDARNLVSPAVFFPVAPTIPAVPLLRAVFLGVLALFLLLNIDHRVRLLLLLGPERTETIDEEVVRLVCRSG